MRIIPVVLAAFVLCVPAAAQKITLTPIKPDVCVEFLGAVAVENATKKALKDFVGKPPFPYDVRDESPKARAWFSEKRALQDALGRAFGRVAEARRDVSESIKDETALRVLNDIVEVYAAHAALGYSISDWKTKAGSLPFPSELGHAHDRLTSTGRTVHHAAVKTACRLGLASDD